MANKCEGAFCSLREPEGEPLPDTTTRAPPSGASRRAPPPAARRPTSPELLTSTRSSDGLRRKRLHPRLVLMGQDIAEYGGAFKVTEGFVEEFGKPRVRNTPIIESGAIGAAMGLALEGLRPMIEMQFGDFITCGFNQIVNNLAKTHYRWGVGLPGVIRVPVGGGTGAGPFHSQNPEAWLTPWPVLKSWGARRARLCQGPAAFGLRRRSPCCLYTSSSTVARAGARRRRGAPDGPAAGRPCAT